MKTLRVRDIIEITKGHLIKDVNPDYKGELLDYEITFAIAAIKNGKTTLPGGESLTHFRDRLTDKLDDTKDMLFGRELRDQAEILIDDLNNCDGLVVSEHEQEEPER